MGYAVGMNRRTLLTLAASTAASALAPAAAHAALLKPKALQARLQWKTIGWVMNGMRVSQGVMHESEAVDVVDDVGHFTIEGPWPVYLMGVKLLVDGVERRTHWFPQSCLVPPATEVECLGMSDLLDGAV